MSSEIDTVAGMADKQCRPTSATIREPAGDCGAFRLKFPSTLLRSG